MGSHPPMHRKGLGLSSAVNRWRVFSISSTTTSGVAQTYMTLLRLNWRSLLTGSKSRGLRSWSGPLLCNPWHLSYDNLRRMRSTTARFRPTKGAFVLLGTRIRITKKNGSISLGQKFQLRRQPTNHQNVHPSKALFLPILPSVRSPPVLAIRLFVNSTSNFARRETLRQPLAIVRANAILTL